MAASKLLLFKPGWGGPDSLTEMIASARAAGFSGLETPAPLDASERAAFFDELGASGLKWIAEFSTLTPRRAGACNLCTFSA